MRNLALFLILIAAFFLLLTDKKGGKGGNGKTSSAQMSPTQETDFSNESLSSEFKPQDLSKYSNIGKLIDDFEYRSSKLDYQLNEEVKEFIKDHDRYGKDQEAYQKMIKHHSKLREEFRDNRLKTLQYYKDTKSNGPMNTDLR